MKCICLEEQWSRTIINSFMERQSYDTLEKALEQFHMYYFCNKDSIKLKLFVQVEDYPEFKSPDDNGYYENCLKHAEDKKHGFILFWIGSTSHDYYLSPLKDPEYISGTPFILIHRSKDNPTFTEFDEGLEDMEVYPYLIDTIACDDVRYNWRFKTSSEVTKFICEFVNYLNSIKDIELKGDIDENLWSLFEENRTFTN